MPMPAKVEWLGGPDDGMVQFVPDAVIETGLLFSAEYVAPTINRNDDPSEFGKPARKIVYPIKRYSVVDAITRRRYEKLMVVFYERKFQ